MPVAVPPPVISTNSIFHKIAVPFSVQPKSAEKPSIFVAVSEVGGTQAGNSPNIILSIEISPSYVPALVALIVILIV